MASKQPPNCLWGQNHLSFQTLWPNLPMWPNFRVSLLLRKWLYSQEMTNMAHWPRVSDRGKNESLFYLDVCSEEVTEIHITDPEVELCPLRPSAHQSVQSRAIQSIVVSRIKENGWSVQYRRDCPFNSVLRLSQPFGSCKYWNTAYCPKSFVTCFLTSCLWLVGIATTPIQSRQVA